MEGAVASGVLQPRWGERPPLLLSPGVGETLDALSGGAVRLLQHRQGYRVNLDPLLLAHFVSEELPRSGRAIDLGTGSGVVPLLLARRFGRAELTGLELQEGLYRLAERNVVLNRAEGEVALVRGDLRHVHRSFTPASFEHVVCNPPYRPASAARHTPDVERAVARCELTCTLPDVAAAARYLTAPRGTLTVVYPAARLGPLLAALEAGGFGARVLRLVHPRASSPAKLALLHAVKGGRCHLTVRPPLHLLDGPAYSTEARAVLGAR